MPGAAVTFHAEVLEDLVRSNDGPAAKACLAMAIKVEREAKHRCPVDTGRLRSSITHFLTRDEQGRVAAVVGSDVEYALYQEVGTRFMDGRHFLIGALDALLGQGHTVTANDLGAGAGGGEEEVS